MFFKKTYTQFVIINLIKGSWDVLTRTDLWIDIIHVFDEEYNPRETKTVEFGRKKPRLLKNIKN